MNNNPMEQQTELSIEQQSLLSDSKMNKTVNMILAKIEQQCNPLAHTTIQYSIQQ